MYYKDPYAIVVICFVFGGIPLLLLFFSLDRLPKQNVSLSKDVITTFIGSNLKILPIGADNDEIISLLIEWTELLAQENYSEALNMFQAYNWEINWTPELLESAVFTYGCPGYTRAEAEKVFGSSDYKITSLYQNPDKNKILESIDIKYYTQEVIEGLAKDLCFEETDYENVIGDINYDNVPINGEMSDLTALFHIKKVDEKNMTLSFFDLHVL